MDNLTDDEQFAVDAIEYGMHPDDLFNHFEAEAALEYEMPALIPIPDNVENVENEHGWRVNENGLIYIVYTVNNLHCVLWSVEDQFILEYGDNTYYVNEHGQVYNINDDDYIGMITEEGGIQHEEGGIQH